MPSGLAVAPDGLILLALSSADLLRGEGALLALDPSGEQRWRWAPGVQRVSAPAVAGGRVCLSADTRALVLLDASTGTERTRIPLPVSASLSAPAVVDDVAYVPCRGPHLLAVGLDGHPGWRFDARASANAWLDHTPVVLAEHLFVTLSSGSVLALRAQDGTLAWRIDVGPAGKRLTPPVTDGERVYVGARDGLHALALADGREAWAFPIPRKVAAAPVVRGDVVYVTSHDRHLYALDVATGEELWRYEVGRRHVRWRAVPVVEVPPLVMPPPHALALAADRGGTLTAVARPLGAAEGEAAGQWVEAASAYAARGRLARGAELLEIHGEPFKAAELWRAGGETARAAQQYESAGAWEQAAELWSVLDRPVKQAGALTKLAESLQGPDGDAERCVAAWQAAAQLYEREGLAEQAAACCRQVARCLEQPVITLDVQHEGLVLDAWTRLQFIVRNEGYGLARNLVVRVRGAQFKGQIAATQEIYTLRPGQERKKWLDVCPQAFGDAVPLRVRAEYEDRAGDPRYLEQTLYLPVARTAATRGQGQQHIMVQGDYVAGDKTTGVDQRGQVVHGPQTNVAGAALSPAPDLAPSPQATRLHRALSDYLDLEEFRTLCFDVGVKYDHLGGEGLAGKARELVRHLQRRDALSLVVEWLHQQRPDIEASLPYTL
jgi:hypothetical protein